MLSFPLTVLIFVISEYNNLCIVMVFCNPTLDDRHDAGIKKQ